MLTYELEQSRTEPLYSQIYQLIRQDIETGHISAGEKLPSKRMLALQLGVSVMTIENAYQQLQAEGYIKSVARKGWYAERLESQLIKKMDSGIFIPEQEQLEEQQGLFPFTVWAKIMREELAGNQRKLLTRTPSKGALELRQAIAVHLKNFRNMEVQPEQIIIGAGTEYLYMLIHILLGNLHFGIEDPGYAKIAAIYASLGLQYEYIPMQEDGIDMDALRNSQADVMHISPSHHFPTGAITSIGKRYALLGWASEQAQRYIIEDDYDSEFRLSGKPIPALFNIDVMEKVIYINTFSKSLTPTIRISYMILPMGLLQKFQKKLSYYSCTVSNFEQYTLARFIQENYFEKHIHRMRKYYKDRRNLLFAEMKKHSVFKKSVISGEDAGLHCLVKFETDLTDIELLEHVKSLGFHAAALQEYYDMKPVEELHVLVFYY